MSEHTKEPWRDQLLSALEQFIADFEGCYADAEPAMIKARSAIAFVKGQS